MGDTFIIALILKGLPMHLEPFFIYVTHSNLQFKTELHSFEKTLKHRDHFHSDDIMKLTSSFSKAMKNKSRDG